MDMVAELRLQSPPSSSMDGFERREQISPNRNAEITMSAAVSGEDALAPSLLLQRGVSADAVMIHGRG